MTEYADTEHRVAINKMLEQDKVKTQDRRKQHERIGEFFLSKTRAFGKLILFGEHFVVYKVPALVGAVAAYTDCEIEFTDQKGVEIIDNRPAVPNYKVEKKEEGDEAIGLVLKHLNLRQEEKGIKLTFGGDLVAVSGIGASAAQVVSLARAINMATGRGLSEDEINAAGYEGEKGYHGTPSGIDNTGNFLLHLCFSSFNVSNFTFSFQQLLLLVGYFAFSVPILHLFSPRRSFQILFALFMRLLESLHLHPK